MKKITALFFLCTIIIFMFMAAYSYAYKKINDVLNPADINVNNTDTQPLNDTINIDWKQLYPFDDSLYVAFEEKKSIAEDIFDHIKERCEAYTSKSLAAYMYMVETSKKYKELLGWNIVNMFEYNGVVKLHDGYLTSFTPPRDVTHTAEAVIKFSEYCMNNGINFFYVNYPVKTCIYEDKDISGKLDFVNQNADMLLAMLNKAGVKYYDFRKILHEDGMNHHEAFYKTDHHWKAETGLWAARHILQILRDDYGWHVIAEVLNPDRFDYVNYPEWFLGSEGKKFTLARTQPDDFVMIYPKFKTLLKYEIPSIGLKTSGDFSITYNMDAVAEKDYYGKNPYGAYDHGDQALITIRNCLDSANKKFLVIHCSFSNSVIPFLSLGIQEIYSIDMRHFTGSIRKYIEQIHPDTVAVIYHSGFVGLTWDESKHNGAYDFR